MDSGGTKYSEAVQINGNNIEFNPYTSYSSPSAIPTSAYLQCSDGTNTVNSATFSLAVCFTPQTSVAD